MMTKSAIAKAFSHGDFQQCYQYLTAHSIWNTPGEQYLTGRNEIESFCEHISAYFKSLTTHFQQHNIVEDDHCVVITGTAEFLGDGKSVNFVSSCDVYEFDADNNINKITSYCISEKS